MLETEIEKERAEIEKEKAEKKDLQVSDVTVVMSI